MAQSYNPCILKSYFPISRNNHRRRTGQAITATRTAHRPTPILSSPTSPRTRQIREHLRPRGVVHVGIGNDGDPGEEARGHGDTRPDLGRYLGVPRVYTTRRDGGQASSFHLYVRVIIRSDGGQI